MILNFQRLLDKTGNFLVNWSNKLEKSSRKQMVACWFSDRGDQTKRLDYDLNTNSIVFDVGGYQGQWTSDIFSRYCCTIYVFEPVKEFYEFIKSRFERNNSIIIHHFGLADKTEKASIFLDRDGSSLFRYRGQSELIQVVRAADFIQQSNIQCIDLMKINIEGGEYNLLEHLIACGFIRYIKNIQIQFHDFVEDAEMRMQTIHDNLERTHHLTYQYLFVWENWERNVSKE